MPFMQVILNALFFNYDLKKSVVEPRIHNQLSPNVTQGESNFDMVGWEIYVILKQPVKIRCTYAALMTNLDKIRKHNIYIYTHRQYWRVLPRRIMLQTSSPRSRWSRPWCGTVMDLKLSQTPAREVMQLGTDIRRDVTLGHFSQSCSKITKCLLSFFPTHTVNEGKNKYTHEEIDQSIHPLGSCYVTAAW